MSFRLEENAHHVRSSYSPERDRWHAQVIGYAVDPVTSVGGDVVAAVVFGATDVEAERRAVIVRDALNAAEPARERRSA